MCIRDRFNILPDPAVIVDGKGTFIGLTASVSSISGFQKEELLGTNFMTSNLITTSSKATLLKNLAKRMLGFHIDPYEIELRHKNGNLMYFEPVSYTHLRAHETDSYLVCRLLLEK